MKKIEVLFADGQIMDMYQRSDGHILFRDTEERHGGYYEMFDSLKALEQAGCKIIKDMPMGVDKTTTKRQERGEQ
jgi:hypothetical protein